MTRRATNWDAVPVILSLQEVAILTNVTYETVLRWVTSKKLRAKNTERKWFVTKDALMEFVGAN